MRSSSEAGDMAIWLLFLMIANTSCNGAEPVATTVAPCTVGPIGIAGCNEALLGPLDTDYRGCQNRTLTGKLCQKWTVQSPQSHSRTPDDFPDKGLGDHNFCRNPDNDATLWCYTTDPETRFEYCAPQPVPCNEEMLGQNDAGYRGCQTMTRGGRTCQSWTQQTPHEHSYSQFLEGLGEHNYCRNPGGNDDTIWCYTRDPDHRWEYCDPLPPGNACPITTTTSPPVTTPVPEPIRNLSNFPADLTIRNTDPWQQTIASAPTGSTIKFEAGVYQACGIEIHHDLTLVGTWGVVIQGVDCAASRIITVNQSTVRVINIAIDGMKQGGCMGALAGATIQLDHCEVSNCMAEDGAGLYVQMSRASVHGGRWHDNVATNWGGAVFAVDAQVNLTDGATFKDNTAAAGGAVMLRSSELRVYRDVLFADNSAISRGGAIGGEVSSFVLLLDGVSFEGGAVDDIAGAGGGGVYISDSVLEASRNVVWRNNAGGYGGGAIAAWNTATVQVSHDVEFRENQGTWGGAVLLSSGAFMLAQYDVRFIKNHAQGWGGAIEGQYQPTSLSLLDNILIQDNVADGAGGGLGLYEVAEIKLLRNVRIVNNDAQSGAGVYAQNDGVNHGKRGNFEFDDVVIADNVASNGGYGGGALFYWFITITIRRSQFLRNVCNYYNSGGAMFLRSAIDLTLEDSLLAENQVYYHGGAFVLWADSVAKLKNVEMVDNQAWLGDSAHIWMRECGAIQRGLVMENVTFSGGRSPNGRGGGVLLFWYCHMVAKNVLFQDIEAGQGSAFLLDSHSSVDADNIEITGCLGSSAGFQLQTSSTVVLRNSKIHNNLGTNSAQIYAFRESLLDISNVQILGNRNSAGVGSSVLVELDSRAMVHHNVLIANQSGGFAGGLYALTRSRFDLFSNVEITGCSAVSGGGVRLEASSILEADNTVRIHKNKALSYGGGIYAWKDSTATLVNTYFHDNSGQTGGGVYLAEGSTANIHDMHLSRFHASSLGGFASVDFSSVLNMLNCELSHCSAEEGGAIFCRGTASLTDVLIHDASSLTDGGAISVASDGIALLNRTTIRSSSSQNDGGCVFASASARLKIIDSRFEHCSSERNGGGVCLTRRSSVEFAGQSTIQGCTSKSRGGAMHVAGDMMNLFHAELNLLFNTATYGAGLSFISAVSMQSARLEVIGNQALLDGGGLYGLGGQGLLTVETDCSLIVAENGAGRDGGGAAMVEFSNVQLVSPVCPSDCLPEWLGDGTCNFECHNKLCNWDYGDCRNHFSQGGEMASLPCDRHSCGLIQERSPTFCDSQCFNAGCDWSESNANCNPWKAHLGSCPLFEAALHRSLVAQNDLVFLSEGTVEGYGRCATSCLRDPLDGDKEKCNALDDSSILKVTPCFECQWSDNMGDAWGYCTDKVRLPTSGWDYNETLFHTVLEKDRLQLFDAYPGCGSQPFSFNGNSAGRYGGGWFQDACNFGLSERGLCFVGLLDQDNLGADILSFENNTAGLSGGGVFVNCPEMSACQSVAGVDLGLPSLESKILDVRDDNTATAYGNQWGSAPSKLLILTHSFEYVPSQTPLNIELQLVDALGQVVRGSNTAQNPHLLSVLICLQGVDQCSNLNSVQNPEFVPMHPTDGSTNLLSSDIRLGSCDKDTDTMLAAISLSGCLDDQEDLTQAVQIQCVQCPAGTSRREIPSGSNAKEMWTCDACSEEQYIVDPTDPARSCMACPAGGICDGSTVAGKVEGSVWQVDTNAGIYRLTSCPAGHSLVNTDGSGQFSHDMQECTPCRTCSEPGTFCATAEYVVDSDVHQCISCPAGGLCDGSTVASKVEGSVWVPDQESGFYLLSSCPAGYSLSRKDASGQFSHDLQECVPCRVCTEPGTFCATAEYVIDPNSHSCQACPVGGECNGKMLRTRGGLDATGEVSWELNQETGQLTLTSCPIGYKLKTESGYDLQECQACAEGWYIISSSDPAAQCKPCPRDMICPNGGLPVNPSHVVSAEIAIQGVELDGADLADQQAVKTAIIAALGQDEVTVEITAVCGADGCQDIGTRRATASSGQRLQGRRQSTGVTVQFRVVGASPDTVGEAMASAGFTQNLEEEMAAQGHTVTVASVVDRTEVSSASSAGDYQLVNGQLKLTDCPIGHLLVNHSADDQYCQACPPLTYSFDPLDKCDRTQTPVVCGTRECTSCPVGSDCLGLDKFDPKVNQSIWEPVMQSGSQLLRLVQCPPAHVLIRDDGVPTLDRCFACPRGKYSIVNATYSPERMTALTVSSAQEQCSACPDGAECAGDQYPTAKAGFWLLPPTDPAYSAILEQNRVDVYRCPLNACEKGGGCLEGREGPACGVCSEGFALSVGRQCTPCDQSAYQVGWLVFFSAVIVFIWYLLVWKKFLDQNGYHLPSFKFRCFRCCGKCLPKNFCKDRVPTFLNRVTSTMAMASVTDSAKILISFYQIVSTYEDVYAVQWPSELKSIWGVARIFYMDFLMVPGLHCETAKLSLSSRLQVYTWATLLVASLCTWPSAILIVMGKRNRADSAKVFNDCWWTLILWFFLLYPFLSVVAVQGFNCRRVGDQNLLVANLAVDCPLDSDDRGAFVWSVIATLLFPVGVPVGIVCVLLYFGVPRLARKKYNDALLQSMIAKYKKLGDGRVLTNFAKFLTYDYIGDHRKYLDELRVKAIHIFDDCCNSQGRLSSTNLRDYFPTVGVTGTHEEELLIWFGIFALDSDGFLDIERFQEFIITVASRSQPYTGRESLDTIARDTLFALSHFKWTDAVQEDAVHRDGDDLMMGDSFASLGRSFSDSIRSGGLLRSMIMRSPGAHSSFSNTRLSPLVEKSECPLPLRSSREELQEWLMDLGKRLVKDGTIGVGTLRWGRDSEEERRAMDAIGFIFVAYKVENWWFELCELLRKFVLTSLMVFLHSGLAAQLVAGLLVSGFSLFFYIRVAPYASTFIERLQIMSLGTQVLVLFYGLIIHVQEVDEATTAMQGEDDALKIVTVCLHILMLLFPFVIITGITWESPILWYRYWNRVYRRRVLGETDGTDKELLDENTAEALRREIDQSPSSPSPVPSPVPEVVQTPRHIQTVVGVQEETPMKPKNGEGRPETIGGASRQSAAILSDMQRAEPEIQDDITKLSSDVRTSTPTHESDVELTSLPATVPIASLLSPECQPDSRERVDTWGVDLEVFPDVANEEVRQQGVFIESARNEFAV